MSSNQSPLTEAASSTLRSDAPQKSPLLATDNPLPDTNQTSLYRVVWRWHFYAGLFVAPFLFLAAATGALYTFHNELSSIFYRDVYYVEPTGEKLSYDEQLRLLKEQAPDFTELDALSLRNDPRRSSEFVAHAHPGGHENPDQMHRFFYVNPYTGKLLGSRILEWEFFHIVLDLHRTLATGMYGRILVELATSWGIVLVITGVYLWWPRGLSQISGVWWPRLKAKPYIILRDLHALSGIYTAVFAIIVLFTGLFVSQVWGTGFNYVSAKMEQSLFDFLKNVKAPTAPPAGAVTSLDPVVATALQNSRPGDNVYFSLAEKPELAHKIYLMQGGDTNTVRGLDIDQYSGALISQTTTEQLTPMVRLLAIAVSLHQGKTFGLASKVVAFVTCVVLMGLSVTGVWMWWIRRPQGKTGFPPRPTRGSVPLWVWGLVIITSLILPTVGASIIAIVVIDSLIGLTGRRRAGPIA